MSAPTVTPERLLDSALWYAAAGWPVLRCEPGGKRPNIGEAWQRLATTDAAVIRRWWRQMPGGNVGLLCGVTFDVLDIEAAAIAPLSSWMAEHDYTLPGGPLAWTGRGGFHAYMQPTGRRKANLWLGEARLGELRTASHQVVAPPSITEMPYRWAVLPTEPLPAMPGWVDELVRRPVARPSAPLASVGNLPADRGLWRLDTLARRVTRSPEGERNAILFWAARRAAAEGQPLEVAGHVLYRAALAVGLGEHDALATIRSGFAWAER